MSTATFIVGDSLTVLRTLPDASVDLVLSSPPFLALRSYLPPDHPDKAQEMGSEPTPGAFIDALLEVVEECRRVLAPHGSLCFELGDTYAGSGGAGGDYSLGGLREGQEKFEGTQYRARSDTKYPKVQRGDMPGGGITNLHGKVQGGGPGWPLDKSLCLVPELFRFALVYGFNPLTGRTTPRWRVRNVVRWVRPNPPVGALADKFRPATSEMVVACGGRKRYFDLDAVRTPPQVVMGRNVAGNNVKGSDDASFRFAERVDSNPAGAPPLDWWAIPTEPYPGSHYATWPSDLCVRPIQAMCPERVCRVCGLPSERVTGEVTYTRDGAKVDEISAWPWGGEEKGKSRQRGGDDYRLTRQAPTLGWTTCGHDDYRPGVVLDPFAGSGTTLAVATGHGRDAIGIDLDSRNAELARQRVGMFLTVVDASALKAATP